MRVWRVIPEGVRFRLKSVDGPITIYPIGLSRWEVVDRESKRSLGLFDDLAKALTFASRKGV